MGSSSSHRVNGHQQNENRVSVRSKISYGNFLEEGKEGPRPRKRSLRNVPIGDENKMYKFEDYVFPMRERNDKSFYAPKYKDPGIKKPESMSFEQINEADSDSDPPSDEDPLFDEEDKENDPTKSYSTIGDHQYDTKPRKKPNRRMSEDVSETASTFIDMHKKRKPKAKMSGINLDTYAELNHSNSGELNEVLTTLMNYKSGDYMKVVALLKEHQHALKTALLMPNKEFIANNQKYKPELSSYSKYSPTEELYGLLLVAKNKNMEIFEFLWEQWGSLWNEHHVMPLLEEMIKAGWCKGIKKLFALPRTREIYESLGTHEKRHFYSCLGDIWDTLEGNDDERSNILLSTLLKSLVKAPYATMTFLLLFPFIHGNSIRVRSKEITLDACEKDFYCILHDVDAIHDLAVEFDEVCNAGQRWETDDSLYMIKAHGQNPQKMKYFKILHRLIQLSYVWWIEPIPINDIWSSIKHGDDAEFRMCCDESSKNWPIILTLQDRYGDTHFSEIYEDDNLKSLKPKKWKPLHFMIYYERPEMITDFINFAGKSVKKAITLDNKKKHISDETVALKLAVRVKSHQSFHVLWRLANQWTLKHLYALLKELNSEDGFWEEIFKTIVKSHTTRDMVYFCSPEIKKDIIKRLQRMAQDFAEDEKRLLKFISKLKKYRQ